jgi:hypothetical protein
MGPSHKGPRAIVSSACADKHPHLFPIVSVTFLRANLKLMFSALLSKEAATELMKNVESTFLFFFGLETRNRHVSTVVFETVVRGCK